MHMINKLTGQPLSEGAINVLERLSNNEAVDLEEIQNLKEIKEAYSCLSSATPTIKLKNREGIQRGVFEKLQKMGSATIDEDGNVSYNGIIRKESRIDIVIGLPASGKSSTLVNPLSQAYKSRIIDSDEAKKLLPEFNNGWGAGTVHEESKLIVKNQMSIALRRKENIVWPIVGGKLEKLEYELIKIKKVNGYKIYIHFCELLTNKAIGRMMLRFFEEGRFLDPKLCCQYGNIGDNYEAIKQKGDLVDGYSKWNNDVAKGDAAILIEATEWSLPTNFYDNTRDGGALRRVGDGAIGRGNEGSRGILQAFEEMGRDSLNGDLFAQIAALIAEEERKEKEGTNNGRKENLLEADNKPNKKKTIGTRKSGRDER